MESFITILVLTFVSLGAYCQDAEYGWPCTNNCRSDLTCVNGHCECRYPRHQSYDSILGLCVSNLFGPCIETADGCPTDIPCVANTECRNETGFPECVCRPGTRQSERSCRSEFGEACQYDIDCFNPASTWDNSVICKNERCDCRPLETFDKATGRCVGLVGAFCGPGYVCVEGASCELFNSFDGTCRCTGSFEPTPDRRCSLFQCPNVLY